MFAPLLVVQASFLWQAQWIPHLAEGKQNVMVLWQLQKRWQTWDVGRGSAKMHFGWQAQFKTHAHQRY